MRAEGIQAMLADPRIDPTTWVGKALLDWIDKNPTQVLSDPVARGYMFDAMDLVDTKILSTGVAVLYKEKQDATIIQNFINAVNRKAAAAAGSEDEYNLAWNLAIVVQNLRSIVDSSTIDSIVELKIQAGDQNDPGSDFLDLLQPRHIKTLIRNRNPNWSSQSWDRMIGLIPKEDLFEYVTGELWEKHLAISTYHNAGDGYPRRIQSILWRAFLRLPEDKAQEWLNFLETTDAKGVWRGAQESMKVSNKYDWDKGIKFHETVCRCGIVTANKSGYSLHANGCNSGINILQGARIFAAQNGKELTCDKCGKGCKSRPGIALHRKKCKSELGDNITAARADQLGSETCLQS